MASRRNSTDPGCETPPALADRFGRRITYLRVSLTDRCNLRCFYCLPRGTRLHERPEILSLEEIAVVSHAAARLGIRKVRLTGGEPLVRRGVDDLIRTLRATPGIEELALSTNGTLLAEHAEALRAAGLMRVNVSLDTLRPEVFRAISGRDDLGRVIDGIDAAFRAGLDPIKINVVVMRGVNDGELLRLLDFAVERGARPRFIEYMPLGLAQRWGDSFVTRAEILEHLRPRLESLVPRHAPGDTASFYPLRGGGEVGVISPVSCHFCSICNRLRLTADGQLRPCLTREGEVDLRAALRPRPDADEIAARFYQALGGRPARGQYLHEPQPGARSMAEIGG